MTPVKRKPARGKRAGKRGGAGRAAAKKRARARLRAARPKQKPKRTAKTSSRAARTAARAAKATRGSTGAKRKAAPAAKKSRRRSLEPRAPRPAPAPAFPQAAGAPAKQQLLFHMVKARASVLAAIQGMSAAAADRPLAAGKWSTRETILHLVARDRARLREMEAALRGTRASWAGADDVRTNRENEEHIQALRHLPWEEAVRLMLTTRQDLMEAVESIPEEPAEVWDAGHPLGWMFQRLPAHDLHHADAIKRGRVAHGA